MNKLLKYSSYGSAIGIVGIVAKPIITTGVTNVVTGVSVMAKSCFALGGIIGVSGGTIIGLVVVSAVVHCVDLDKINYKKLLGWEDNEVVGSDDDLIELSSKIKESK